MTGPPHTVLCLSGKTCPADCPRALSDGLPREPDWSTEVPGQADLLALLEEDAR